jgi:O-antigen ligase
MAVPGVYERLLSIGVIREIVMANDPGVHMFVKGESSLATRFAVLRSGIDVIAQNFFLGIGTGDFQEEVGAQTLSPYGLSPAAHNSFLEIAAENGVPAMVLFAVGLFLIIARLGRCYRESGSMDCVASAMSLIALTAAMMALNVLQNRLTWIILAIGFTMPRVLAQVRRQSSPAVRGTKGRVQ